MKRQEKRQRNASKPDSAVCYGCYQRTLPDEASFVP